MFHVKRVLAAVLLTGCAQLQGATEALTSACHTYVSVAAIVQLVVLLHPNLGASVKAITAAVDPVCSAVLAGQPAPAGIDAAWVNQRTIQLEELERGAR